MVEVKPGCHVYARGGIYVGHVEAANSELLRIHGIGPLYEVFYVPVQLIAGALHGGREIFIDCAHEDLDTKGWLKPPHGIPVEPNEAN